MPRIPRAQARNSYQVADMPHLVGDGWTAPGRATQQLGQSIGQLGRAFASLAGEADQQAEAEQMHKAKIEALELKNTWDLDEIQSQANYTGDGTDYTSSRTTAWAQRSGEYQQKWANSTPRIRRFTEMFVATNTGSVAETAARFGRSRWEGDLFSRTDAAVTGQFAQMGTPEAAERYKSDPSLFEKDLRLKIAEADRIIDALPLRDGRQDALRAKAADQVEKIIQSFPPSYSIKAIRSKIDEFREPKASVPGPQSSVGGNWKVFDTATPTATERRQIAQNGGVVVNLDTNWAPSGRATSPMVVIPDGATSAQRAAAEAYASGVAQIYNKQFGTNMKPRVVTRSQNGRGRAHTIHTEPFSVNDTRAVDYFSSDEGRQAHAELLRNTFGKVPGVAFSLPHDPTRKGDNGAVGPKGSEVDLARPLLAMLKGPGGEPQLVEGPQEVGGQQAKTLSRVDLTAYSPQRGGDAMQGGYASSRPGPDGKAEVRTLDDVAAGRSDYVTLAGSPQFYGREYTIPKIDYIDANGKTRTLTDVKAVVHDTGSAFKTAPEGRFDVAVARDVDSKARNANHGIWKKNGVQFIPRDGNGSVSRETNGTGRALVPDTEKAGRGDNRIPTRVAQNTTQMNDAGAQPGGTAPLRPSVESHLVKRLQSRLPALQQAYAREVSGIVKSVDEGAGRGILPTEQQQARIAAMVADLGDEAVTAAYRDALFRGQVTAQYKALPPQAIAADVARFQSMAATRGADAATIKRLDALAKLQDRMVAELKKDPRAWAVEAGVLTPSPEVDHQTFGPEMLAQRAQETDALAAHYGEEFRQYFSPTERERLKERFSAGGKQLVADMGMMVEAFGPDAIKALGEIAKDAPAAAHLGWLVVNKAGNQTVKDLADAVALRRSEGFKSMAPSPADARVNAIAGLDRTFAATPQTEQRIIDVANLLYEVRARRQGLDPKAVDWTVWTEGLLEATGRNVDEATGISYGGLAQEAGMIYGTNQMGTGVLLPPNVRSDSLPELLGAIRMADLAPGGTPTTSPQPGADDAARAADAAVRMGYGNPAAMAGIYAQGAPVDAKGRPIRLAALMNGHFVTIGPGRYHVSLTDPYRGAPEWVASSDGPDGRFVLDLTALEPALRQRVPDAYRPY